MILKLIALVFVIQSCSASIYSSVWCHGSHQDHRHCSFNNLCYSPHLDRYIFFHSGNKSVISGLDDPSEQFNLVRLSTLTGNNEFYLNYISMPQSSSDRFDIEFVESPVLLLKRWKPLDPFHMIHDDLLPIYATLKFLCFNDVHQCSKDFIIGVEDQVKSELYESLFPNVMYLSRYATFFSDDQLLCFKKVTVGLEHETLWFNHGFDSLSGPISNMNYQPYMLEEFRQFVLSKLNIKTNKCPPNLIIVFESEHFANYEAVVNALKKKYPKLQFISINPKKMSSLTDLIKKVSCAKALIAFHSSYNVLSLFLKRRSGLLELFPYGLDESTLSQFSKLTSLRNLHYQSWINFDAKSSEESVKSASVLSHLDQAAAESIVKLEHVAPVSCCNDAALLYKLDQVTTVGIDEFMSTFQQFWDDLTQLKNEEVGEDATEEAEDDNDWIIPAPIHGAKCRLDNSLNIAEISWSPPLNLNFVKQKHPNTRSGDKRRIVYEILAEAQPHDSSSGNDHIGDFSTTDRKIVITLTGIQIRKYSLIKASIITVVDNDIRSGEAIVTCDLDQI